MLLEQTVNIFFTTAPGSGTNLQITSIAQGAVGVATEVGRARGLGPRFSNEIRSGICAENFFGEGLGHVS